jgi:hypothetical protein
MILVTIPGLRLENEANRRDKWGKIKRAKVARAAALLAVGAADPPGTLAGPLTVTITRIAPRRFDSDGIPASAKAVRDGVADALGIDDGDDRIVWLYAQRKGGVRVYGVEIAIRPGRACPTCGSAIPTGS